MFEAFKNWLIDLVIWVAVITVTLIKTAISLMVALVVGTVSVVYILCNLNTVAPKSPKDKS